MLVVLISKAGISGNHNHYMKYNGLAEHEGNGRELFSSNRDDLTREEANAHLSNGQGKPEDGVCFEIVISLKDKATYERFEKDPRGAKAAFKETIREGLDALFTDLGVKDVRWTAAIHLNTDHPHAHVAVAPDCTSIETGRKRIINDIPRTWKFTEGDEPSRAASHLENATQGRLIPLPPSAVEVIPPSYKIRQLMPAKSLDDEVGRGEQERVLTFLTDEKELSPTIVQEQLTGGTIYATRGGVCVFVHRDFVGNVTGATVRGKEVGQGGYFYVGDLRTATRYVFADTPGEALSLYDLTRGKDLAKVAFVSLSSAEPDEELLKLIATRKEDVKVVWALSLNQDGQQNVEGLERTRQRLSETAAEELIEHSIEVITYAPNKNYGLTWNSQLMHRHLRGELEAIESGENPAQEAQHQPRQTEFPESVTPAVSHEAEAEAEAAATEKVRDELAPARGEWTTADALSSLPLVVTLPPEQDVLDGTRAFNKREAEREAARLRGEEEAKTREELKPAASAKNEQPKIETSQLREIPLESVLHAHGLRLRDYNGERVYVDADKNFVIKVTRDLFSDRKDSLNGGKGAIDLVMHLQGVDFRTARNWLIENYQGGKTAKLAERPRLKDVEDEPKPLRIHPPNNVSLQAVKDYLIEKRGLSPEIVEYCIRNGTLYGNSFNSCVFIHRDPHGHITGAEWRSTDTHLRGTASGTDKSVGWFYLGDLRTARRFVVVEAPIDTLSYVELHKDAKIAETCFISLNGGSIPRALLEHIADRAKTIENVELIWALDNNPAGHKSREAADRSFARMTQALDEIKTGFLVNVERHEPIEKDWNDDLRVKRGEGAFTVKEPSQPVAAQPDSPAELNFTYYKIVGLDASNPAQPREVYWSRASWRSDGHVESDERAGLWVFIRGTQFKTAEAASEIARMCGLTNYTVNGYLVPETMAGETITQETLRAMPEDELIVRMENAPDFSYDAEEKELSRRLALRGLDWRWSRATAATGVINVIEAYPARSIEKDERAPQVDRGSETQDAGISGALVADGREVSGGAEADRVSGIDGAGRTGDALRDDGRGYGESVIDDAEEGRAVAIGADSSPGVDAAHSTGAGEMADRGLGGRRGDPDGEISANEVAASHGAAAGEQVIIYAHITRDERGEADARSRAFDEATRAAENYGLKISSRYVSGTEAQIQAANNALESINSHSRLEILTSEDDIHLARTNGRSDWELSLEDFSLRRHINSIRSYKRSIRRAEDELKELGGRGKARANELENNIRFWQKIVDDPGKHLEGNRAAYEKAYVAIVSKAVSQDLPVPQAVIDSNSIFQAARNHRAAYEVTTTERPSVELARAETIQVPDDRTEAQMMFEQLLDSLPLGTSFEIAGEGEAVTTCAGRWVRVDEDGRPAWRTELDGELNGHYKRSAEFFMIGVGEVQADVNTLYALIENTEGGIELLEQASIEAEYRAQQPIQEATAPEVKEIPIGEGLVSESAYHSWLRSTHGCNHLRSKGLYLSEHVRLRVQYLAARERGEAPAQKGEAREDAEHRERLENALPQAIADEARYKGQKVTETSVRAHQRLRGIIDALNSLDHKLTIPITIKLDAPYEPEFRDYSAEVKAERDKGRARLEPLKNGDELVEEHGLRWRVSSAFTNRPETTVEAAQLVCVNDSLPSIIIRDPQGNYIPNNGEAIAAHAEVIRISEVIREQIRREVGEGVPILASDSLPVTDLSTVPKEIRELLEFHLERLRTADEQLRQAAELDESFETGTRQAEETWAMYRDQAHESRSFVTAFLTESMQAGIDGTLVLEELGGFPQTVKARMMDDDREAQETFETVATRTIIDGQTVRPIIEARQSEQYEAAQAAIRNAANVVAGNDDATSNWVQGDWPQVDADAFFESPYGDEDTDPYTMLNEALRLQTQRRFYIPLAEAALESGIDPRTARPFREKARERFEFELIETRNTYQSTYDEVWACMGEKCAEELRQRVEAVTARNKEQLVADAVRELSANDQARAVFERNSRDQQNCVIALTRFTDDHISGGLSESPSPVEVAEYNIALTTPGFFTEVAEKLHHVFTHYQTGALVQTSTPEELNQAAPLFSEGEGAAVVEAPPAVSQQSEAEASSRGVAFLRVVGGLSVPSEGYGGFDWNHMHSDPTLWFGPEEHLEWIVGKLESGMFKVEVIDEATFRTLTDQFDSEYYDRRGWPEIEWQRFYESYYYYSSEDPDPYLTLDTALEEQQARTMAIISMMETLVKGIDPKTGRAFKAKARENFEKSLRNEREIYQSLFDETATIMGEVAEAELRRRVVESVGHLPEHPELRTPGLESIGIETSAPDQSFLFAPADEEQKAEASEPRQLVVESEPTEEKPSEWNWRLNGARPGDQYLLFNEETGARLMRVEALPAGSSLVMPLRVLEIFATQEADVLLVEKYLDRPIELLREKWDERSFEIHLSEEQTRALKPINQPTQKREKPITYRRTEVLGERVTIADVRGDVEMPHYLKGTGINPAVAQVAGSLSNGEYYAVGHTLYVRVDDKISRAHHQHFIPLLRMRESGASVYTHDNFERRTGSIPKAAQAFADKLRNDKEAVKLLVSEIEDGTPRPTNKPEAAGESRKPLKQWESPNTTYYRVGGLDRRVGVSLGYVQDEESGRDHVRLKFPDETTEDFTPHSLFPAEPSEVRAAFGDDAARAYNDLLLAADSTLAEKPQPVGAEEVGAALEDNRSELEEDAFVLTPPEVKETRAARPAPPAMQTSLFAEPEEIGAHAGHLIKELQAVRTREALETFISHWNLEDNLERKDFNGLEREAMRVALDARAQLIEDHQGRVPNNPDPEWGECGIMRVTVGDGLAVMVKYNPNGVIPMHFYGPVSSTGFRSGAPFELRDEAHARPIDLAQAGAEVLHKNLLVENLRKSRSRKSKAEVVDLDTISLEAIYGRAVANLSSDREGTRRSARADILDLEEALPEKRGLADEAIRLSLDVAHQRAVLDKSEAVTSPIASVEATGERGRDGESWKVTFIDERFPLTVEAMSELQARETAIRVRSELEARGERVNEAGYYVKGVEAINIPLSPDTDADVTVLVTYDPVDSRWHYGIVATVNGEETYISPNVYGGSNASRFYAVENCFNYQVQNLAGLDEKTAEDITAGFKQVLGALTEHKVRGEIEQPAGAVESEAEESGSQAEAEVVAKRSEPAHVEEDPIVNAEELAAELAAQVAEAQAERAARGPNYIIEDVAIHDGGAKTRFRWNVEAIETLRQIESEERLATDDEKHILARFSGFGSMPGAFNKYSDDAGQWTKERDQIKRLLTEEEYDAASRSTLNAHFTHPSVVDAIWKTVTRMGFEGGRVLEPAMGSGVFFGRIPENLREHVQLTGVELDSITGRIAKLLYPQADVHNIGYQNFNPPNGWFDLVISNVPFGKYNVHDPDYNKYNANIHDYFILKSLDKVRDGGLVVCITSTFTLDKQDSRLREKMMERADLVAAVRLPDSAFTKNAGTQVVTDILILQKRAPLEKRLAYAEKILRQKEEISANAELKAARAGHPDVYLESVYKEARREADHAKKELESAQKEVEALRAGGTNGVEWMKVVPVDDPDGGEPIPVNEYFAERPEMICGKLDRTGSMYHDNNVRVHLEEKQDLDRELYYALTNVPRYIYESEPQNFDAGGIEKLVTHNDKIKAGGLIVQEGVLFRRVRDRLVKQEKATPDQIARAEKLLKLRDTVRTLFNHELAGEMDAATEVRERLNKEYKIFNGRFGPIHSPKNQQALEGDPDLPLLLALEKEYTPGTSRKPARAVKADIFTRPTLRGYTRPDKAENINEALSITLNEYGRLHLNRICELLGKEPKDVGDELTATGLAYQNPRGLNWEIRDEYLSGNVRAKLNEAKEAVKDDPRFEANVKALETVIPKDVDHVDIGVRLGSSWVPADDIRDFMAHLVGGHRDDFVVKYAALTGSWTIGYSRDGALKHRFKPAAVEIWGTDRADLIDVVQHACDARAIVVRDRVEKDKYIVNKEDTEAANAKVAAVKAEFKDWIWTDAERRDRLHRYYNDNFNNIAPKRFDGSHLTFPGMNPEIKLRKNQVDAVWRTISTGKAIYAHKVGRGKTYTMIAAAMEMKRLGLVEKPAIACLKGNIGEITAAAHELYPGIRVLSTLGNFDKAQRKEIVAQMATGDYDLIIMTHDNLDMLPMYPETRAKYIKEELKELEETIYAAALGSGKDSNRLVKTLENAKAKLEADMLEILEKNKDDAVNFEETGIDFLFVDEFHKYKSLKVYTKQDRVKGIPATRSDRATNMLARIRWLLEQHDGRGAVGGTGTPISNTTAELFNLQRYFQWDELNERGIRSFDAWASVFGETVTKIERTATGSYKEVTRFAKFTNLPELIQLTHQVMDVCMEDVPEIKLPKRVDEVITSGLSDEQQSYLLELQQRAEDLKGKYIKEKGADNMLAISNDARKMSLDMRLVSPGAADDPQNKVNNCVRDILKNLTERPDITQLVFSDMGVHENDWGFSVYKDLREKLIAGGLKPEEVIDFSKLTEKARKKAIEDLAIGRAKVGIGSTDKLGTGTNVQYHLYANHNLDVHWLPSSQLQRDGRIERQGNKHAETGEPIKIKRYVTVGGFDEIMYSAVDRKIKFIDQIMRGDVNGVGREFVEADGEELSAAQIAAIASGNPDVLRKVELEEEVGALERSERRHKQSQIRLEEDARDMVVRRGQHEKHIERLKADAETLRAATTDEDGKKREGFFAVIKGKEFTKRKEAGEELERAFSAARNGDTLGTYKGFPIVMRQDYAFGTLFSEMNLIGEYGHYEVNYATTDGIFTSMDASLRSIEKLIASNQEQIRVLDTNGEKIKNEIGKPFKEAERLKELRAELVEVEKRLRDAGVADGTNVKTGEITFQKYEHEVELRNEGVVKELRRYARQGGTLIKIDNKPVGWLKQDDQGALVAIEIKQEYRRHGVASRAVHELYEGKEFKCYPPDEQGQPWLEALGRHEVDEETGLLTVKPYPRVDPEQEKGATIIGYQTRVAVSEEEQILNRYAEQAKIAVEGYRDLTGQELSADARNNLGRMMLECSRSKPTDEQELKIEQIIEDEGLEDYPEDVKNQVDAAIFIAERSIDGSGNQLWVNAAMSAAKEAEAGKARAASSDVGKYHRGAGRDRSNGVSLTLDQPLSREKTAGREVVGVRYVAIPREQIYDPDGLIQGTNVEQSQNDRDALAARMLAGRIQEPGAGDEAKGLDKSPLLDELNEPDAPHERAELRTRILRELGYEAEARFLDGDRESRRRELIVFDLQRVRTIERDVQPEVVRKRAPEFKERAEDAHRREQEKPARLISGREVVARYQLQQADHKQRAAIEQTDLRRYKVEFNGEARRISVKDIENLSKAIAHRQTAIAFEGEFAKQQDLPPVDRKSPRVLRMEMEERFTAAELSRHADVLEALRAKHEKVIGDLNAELSRAQGKYVEAVEEAVEVAAQEGNKMPAPIVSLKDLNELHDAAADRRDAPALLALDRLRQSLIAEFGETMQRDDHQAARLSAQHRMAELTELVCEHNLSSFEETYHQRRFTVEGESRNDYMPETRGSDEEEGRTDDMWSLKDVAKARKTVEMSHEWLARNATHYEGQASFKQLLLKIADQHFNPVTHLKMEAQIITDPKNYVGYHVSALRQLESNPVIQSLRFVQNYGTAREQAEECRRLAGIELQKLDALNGIERSVKEQIVEKRIELQADLAEQTELRRALDTGIKNEMSQRTARGVAEMPRAAFEDYEIRRIEANAMQLQDGEILKEYEAEAISAKAGGLLKEENLPMRSVGRELVTEARVIKAQLQLDVLDRVIETATPEVQTSTPEAESVEPLRVRDVTPVRVNLDGEDRVLSLRDVAEESDEVRQAVTDALEAHEARLAGELAQAKEFHEVTNQIAEAYRTELAARGAVPRPPQFTIKEHLEIERFGAGVEDEALYGRFSEIARTALEEGCVIGIDKALTQPLQDATQNALTQQMTEQFEHSLTAANEGATPTGLNALSRSVGVPETGASVPPTTTLDPLANGVSGQIQGSPTVGEPSIITDVSNAIETTDGVVGPEADAAAAAEVAEIDEAAATSSLEIFL